MKKLLALLVISVALIVAGSRTAGAHSAYIRCEGTQLHYHADSYTTGRYTIDGGTAAAFEGGFDFVRPGDHVGRLTITAPDWPTFSSEAGPCQGGTTSTSTTVPSSSSTSAVPPPTSTTVVSSSTTSTSSIAPSPTSSAPSPTVTPTSSPPSPPSTAQQSSTPSAPSSTASSPASPPQVPTLPVTGSNGILAVLAFMMLAIGVGLILAVRR